jgi:hypothetical protein
MLHVQLYLVYVNIIFFFQTVLLRLPNFLTQNISKFMVIKQVL